MTDTGVGALCRAVSTRLQHLDLSGCFHIALGGAGGGDTALRTLARRCTRLQSLRLAQLPCLTADVLVDAVRWFVCLFVTHFD
jgi:hypothetical protein